MGIDPGTVDLGVAFLAYDSHTGDVVDIFTRNINAYDIHRNTDQHYLRREDLDASYRTDLMVEQLHRLVRMKDPDFLAIEAPFSNPSRVNTFAILVLHFRKLLNMGIDADLDTYKFAPTSVKKSFSCTGKKGKGCMRESLREIDELHSVLNKPVSDMSEHEIDAVAVCYTALLKARKGELE